MRWPHDLLQPQMPARQKLPASPRDEPGRRAGRLRRADRRFDVRCRDGGHLVGKVGEQRLMFYPSADDFDDELDDLRMEAKAERQYRSRLSRHPDCRDPEHFGCEACEEDDQAED